MAYCTTMDVRRRLPEVTADIVPDADISEFIQEADGHIDDALRDIYNVPFETVPVSIENISAMWAAYTTLTLYPDSNVEEDLDRLKSDIDMLLNKYIDRTASLGSEYESADSHGENVFYVSRPGKYSYYGV